MEYLIYCILVIINISLIEPNFRIFIVAYVKIYELLLKVLNNLVFEAGMAGDNIVCQLRVFQVKVDWQAIKIDHNTSRFFEDQFNCGYVPNKGVTVNNDIKDVF
ncbi:hypothetical protein CANDROIZ_120004 [Candidatus Roizmanbacteria bacterium]|nr:hypothetical protein CANDROIZ_120004 [Candidatus Roizmanbacteria bacterium]